MSRMKELKLALVNRTIEKIKQGWTIGAFARNGVAKHVSAYSTEAICWCLEGAMLAAYQEIFAEKKTALVELAFNLFAAALLREAKKRRPGTYSVIDFNDRHARGVEDVIAALEATKAKIEEEQVA